LQLKVKSCCLSWMWWQWMFYLSSFITISIHAWRYVVLSSCRRETHKVCLGNICLFNWCLSDWFLKYFFILKNLFFILKY
jgi:hypothetical protein